MWKVRKIISKGDYLYAYVPEHPKCTKNGYVLLHRVVMENHLGRILNSNEVVHHIDENKKNNELSNLMVMDYREHVKFHVGNRGSVFLLLKCPWCSVNFERRKGNTFLYKKSKLNCTCCSPSCRGKLSRFIQLNGITHELKDAISGNILSEFVKYKYEDNPEETLL